MYTISGVILSSLLFAQARSLDPAVQLRYMRRDSPFANTTASTSTTIPDTTRWNSTRTTTTFVISTASTTSKTADPFTSEGSRGPSAPTSSLLDKPPFQFQNVSTTTTEPTCLGIATYYETVPPTVFLTVTEGYDVTVTSGDVASMTAPDTLITPLPPCESTVMSAEFDSTLPNATGEGGPDGVDTPKKSSKDQPYGFGSRTQNQPQFNTFYPNLPYPPAPASTQPETLGTNQPVTAPYSIAPYTSTVIVTKKTPITVIVAPTTSPPVNFGDMEPMTPQQNTMPPPPRIPSQSSSKPNGNGNNNIVSPPTTTPPVTSSAFPGAIGGGPRGTTTTTVNGIPIVIQPSTVVIGEQSFAIPTSARTSVQVNGVGFGLGPSEIAAPSTTITFAPPPQGSMITITPRPAPTTVPVGNGQSLVVGQTVAVIAGTTYRVGDGAPATTITVDGTTISVGSNGVALPRTVVSPVGAVASGYVVYTINGFTFSVDDSEAVLSSTTYRIGSDAPQTTTVVSGHTVSFGPNGIGLESTTIAPTAVPTASTGAGSSDSASATGGTANAAPPSSSRIPFSESLGWYLMVTTCVLYNFLS